MLRKFNHPNILKLIDHATVPSQRVPGAQEVLMLIPFFEVCYNVLLYHAPASLLLLTHSIWIHSRTQSFPRSLLALSGHTQSLPVPITHSLFQHGIIQDVDIHKVYPWQILTHSNSLAPHSLLSARYHPRCDRHTQSTPRSKHECVRSETDTDHLPRYMWSCEAVPHGRTSLGCTWLEGILLRICYYIFLYIRIYYYV